MKSLKLVKLLTLVVISLTVVFTTAVLGQYQGEPVKRERLIQVLRSKQFQARDIVQIINENGVDFKLTPAIESDLISAGARPTVIDAVRRNYRGETRAASNAAIRNSNTSAKPGTRSYNSYVDEAVEAYDIQRNIAKAEGLLQQAMTLQPNNPRAYQLLGFISLYGKKDISQAEAQWAKSISLGGNAVLRVIHDHDGSFLRTCEGSLYISQNILRFESDDNNHTFETQDTNIKSIDMNSKWLRAFQLKGGSFKVVLRKEDGTSRYSFAPLSGKEAESKMIIKLIGK